MERLRGLWHPASIVAPHPVFLRTSLRFLFHPNRGRSQHALIVTPVNEQLILVDVTLWFPSKQVVSYRVKTNGHL